MDEPAGLKRELHVSGYDVTLEVDDEVLTQGDTVRGRVTVAAGRDPGVVTVRMQEFWPRTEGADGGALTTRTSRRTVQEEVLTTFSPTRIVRRYATAFQVEEGRVYPFEVQLPRNARLSTPRAGWQLVVSIVTEHAAYPQAERVRLNVGLAEEVEAVLDVWVSRLKFAEESERRRWCSERVSTTFRLLPPKVLEPALDAVVLELQQDDAGGVLGAITFDRAERGVADYFKALLDRDKVTRKVALSSQELYGRDLAFRDDDVARAFGNLLNEIVTT